MPTSITVSGLYVYPIKSCGGTVLDQADVGPRGIEHDREFMVVDAATGLFLTQRELPRMALIRPEIAGAVLHLRAPGMPDLAIQTVPAGEERDVIVWRDRCRAVDQGAEVAGWLSEFLRTPCRLVRMAEDYVRHVDPAYAVDPADQVGFADGYPFLLISEESLDDLNSRLPEPLPMNRFRPNIVVAGGGAPYMEDRWRRLAIGTLTMHIVKACARCTITTTDQDTGARAREPLATLAGYRRVERGVLFGQNVIHRGSGTIRCGDPVSVLD